MVDPDARKEDGMSRYSNERDTYGRGASRRVREQKREEAEERNARTPVERTRRYREGTAENRLLMDAFAGV